MKFITHRYLNLALRLLLGGVFLYAAWHKVLYPQQFAISIRAYQIVPVSISNLFALSLAWGEGLAGTMLILGILPRKSAGAVFIFLVMFIAALSTVLIRGMVIDCGCFKSGEHASSGVGPTLIVRNVFLLAAAWLVIQYNDGFLCLYSRRRGESDR
ncbi:MAG: DoxX family membrane protein [Candidatus Krumholzibacteriota bacterium]|nr:DoxX family membrane protein [Candidatus Krumholzibacteriota bacterium]